MSELKDLQQHFMNYLLDEPSTIIDEIESTPMRSAEGRLAIYASAYKSRLKEAILTDYDKLASYLGDEQFDNVMDRYIEKHPSHTTSLRYFSINLPELVRDEAPYNQFPELYEIASIERGFANSFDAKDTVFTTINDLATLPPEAWETLSFEFQQSAQILNLKHNSFSIWKALSEDLQPPKLELAEQVNWVVWRRSNLVSHYRALSIEEEVALRLAIKGETFAAICEQLLQFFSEEETPVKAITFLQSWVEEEMLAGLNY